jgi:hypothetical protein
MHMHRVSASVQGCASRFGDRSWITRCSRVKPVAIQRGLQEDGGLHVLSVPPAENIRIAHFDASGLSIVRSATAPIGESELVFTMGCWS